jgi:hypothetical protein
MFYHWSYSNRKYNEEGYKMALEVLSKCLIQKGKFGWSDNDAPTTTMSANNLINPWPIL